MSEHSVNLKLIIDSFKRGLAQAESGIKRFTSATKREFAGLDKAGRTTKNLLTGNWQLLGGAVAGAAIYGAAKKVMDLDDSVRRIAIDSNMSSKEMLAFKEQILDTSRRTGTSVDEVTNLGKAAIKSSKDVKFVREELSFMNTVMQASGASGAEVGEALGDIREKTGITGKAFEDLISTLYAFGKTTGREATFKDILPQIPELVKTVKAIYPKAGMKEISDFITTSMFVGDPAVTIKAYKRILMASAKTGKKDFLGALGFKAGGPIPTIQQVVAAATKGTTSYEAKLNALIPIFGKNTTELQKLLQMSDEYGQSLNELKPGAVFEDAANQAQSFSAVMNKLDAMFTTGANAALLPALNSFKDSLSKISPEDMAALTSNFAALGKSIGDVVNAGIKFLNWWGDLWTRYGQIAGSSPLQQKLETQEFQKRAGEAIQKYQASKVVGIEGQGGLSKIFVTNEVYLDSDKLPTKSKSTTTNDTGRQLNVK